ncbi:MAG: hypothetical protein IT373_17355 [Polyangiaceae bacterium]|nr:hypothetical protein [Polyangiaceae bacterium]
MVDAVGPRGGTAGAHPRPWPDLGWLAFAGLACLACGAGPPVARHGRGPRPPPAVAGPSCSFEVRQRAAGRGLFDVEGRCPGAGLAGFAPTEPAVAAHLTAVTTARGAPLVATNDVFTLPPDAAPEDADAIRYTVDLDALAEDREDFDLALRSGGSLLAPASSFVLCPSPASKAGDIAVTVRMQSGERFTSGMRFDGERYHLGAHEVGVSTYGVFGRFTSEPFELPGRFALGPPPAPPGAEPPKAAATRAAIELVTLEGPLESSAAERRAWVERVARAVAAFYRGFPVARTVVVVVPLAGHGEVAFGKVVPASGPTVLLTVGASADAAALGRDWILAHELFHLGVPSFAGRGKWLDEGLATYFEPLVRVRAGLLDPAIAWRDFYYGMRAAAAALGAGRLDAAKDYRDVYWGGALIALLTDLAARERAAGGVGLEVGLRAVLGAGGDASTVWSLEDVVRAVDGALGAPLLAEHTRTYAERGAPVDVDALFAALGVHVDGEQVSFDDDAPRAALRRALVAGDPAPSD